MTKVPQKYKVFFIGSGLWTVVDQATKHFIVSRLEIGESLQIFPGFFNLISIRNPGVAFGFLSQMDSALRFPFLILVPLFALGIIFFLIQKIENCDVTQSIGYSLIAGGALGNLTDRIRLGHVVDFLDFHFLSIWHYPAFNFADVGICVGVGILILTGFSARDFTVGNTGDKVGWKQTKL